MANDTISQTKLFEVCRDVLFDSIKPIYYRDLTVMALNKLSISITTTRSKTNARVIRSCNGLLSTSAKKSVVPTTAYQQVKSVVPTKEF